MVEEEEELKLTQELAEELEAAEEKGEGTGEAEGGTVPVYWECPICGRPQVAEDAEFNQHVDFCLSRGAIREAVEEVRGKPPKRVWEGVEEGGKRRKETS